MPFLLPLPQPVVTTASITQRRPISQNKVSFNLKFLNPQTLTLTLSLFLCLQAPLPQPAVTAASITQQRPISQNKENTTFLGCFQHQTTQGGEFSLLGFDFSSTSDIYSSPWNHYLVYVLRNIFG